MDLKTQTHLEGNATVEPRLPGQPAAIPALPPAPAAGGNRVRPAPPRRRRLSAVLAAIVAALAKLKALVLVLAKLKFLATAGTAFVSVGAYSLLFGWPFAVGLVGLLFVHEMGHVIQLRREGVKANAPMFIPFLGAVIAARSLGRNALAEARVGLAGPLAGSVAAAAVALAAALTHDRLLYALAYTGFFINLFNLIPVTPLDGGRAMAAMAPAMWVVGLVVLVAAALLLGNPLVFVFVLIGFFDVRRRLGQRRQGGPEQEAYYAVTPKQRLYVGAVYIALLVVLLVGMHAALVVRTT
jgi:Zn-dependent protease